MVQGREGRWPRGGWWRSVGVVGLGIAVVLVTGCDPEYSVGPPVAEEEWSDFGLDGRAVMELSAAEHVLYAATDDGVFRRNSGAGTWTAAGFSGRWVNAVLPLGGDTLLAAAAIDWDADVVASLYRSTDGGGSWHAFQNGFGGEDPGLVLSLVRLPDGTVLAGGGAAVVARSTDDGQSWEVAWGDWDMIALGTHFFHVDPVTPGTVWSGGEQGAFVPFLLRSTDAGAAWEEYFLDLGGDNAHYSVVVDPATGAVLTGTEGFVLRSLDHGASWETVLAPDSYPYFFGLEAGGGSSPRLFAAGAVNTDLPQDLIVHISDDVGDTWRQVGHPNGRKGGVLSTLLLADGDRDALYLGTTDGVVRLRVSR